MDEYVFLYKVGESDVCDLKYFPKDEIVEKFNPYAISFIDLEVQRSWTFTISSSFLFIQ